MRSRQLTRSAYATAACLLLGACGKSAPADVSTPTAGARSIPAAAAGQGRLRAWPEFDLNPQRTGSSELQTGITSANVAHLRRTTVRLPGTVDSSAIYLPGASVAGAIHDVALMTTTYGRTVALDVNSGRSLWTFTPPGYASWAGSAQITTATPLADPDGQSLYAASPDGLIHRLALATGAEQRGGGWPVRVTLEPQREKIAAALNIAGPYLLAATGGYYGDAPPYQGHLVLIDRAGGRVRAVFNTLCANRRALIVPGSCHASDSAVWARAGAVVEPGASRVLIDTGNGPWNGTTNFGDSVIELTLPGLGLRQVFTPSEQKRLNENDADLGSSAPVLLGANRVLVAGKDGVIRVLELSRIDGRPPSGSSRHQLGGELQRLQTPGGGELFTAPVVWRRGTRTTVFLADEAGTAAYALSTGRLYRVWQNTNAGSSPVMAGGLLYVYDPAGGVINVYTPRSQRPLTTLPARSGHWNSPTVIDGHVLEPEGNANEHALTGTLDIFSAG